MYFFIPTPRSDLCLPNYKSEMLDAFPLGKPPPCPNVFIYVHPTQVCLKMGHASLHMSWGPWSCPDRMVWDRCLDRKIDSSWGVISSDSESPLYVTALPHPHPILLYTSSHLFTLRGIDKSINSILLVLKHHFASSWPFFWQGLTFTFLVGNFPKNESKYNPTWLQNHWED